MITEEFTSTEFLIMIFIHAVRCFCVLPSDHCPAGNRLKFHRVLVVKTKNFVRCIHV